MKLIPLTQGQFAMVDDGDYDELMKFKWWAKKGKNTYYAGRRNGRLNTLMHRHLMGDIKGVAYDHADGNGLNNQRSNLRVATSQENSQNRTKQSNCSSKYKGACWEKRIGKWVACIRINCKHISIGRFNSEE